MSDEEMWFAPKLSFGRTMKRAYDGKFYFDHDEFNSQTSAYYSAATKGATLMYTVATGLKFHLRTFSVTNVAGGEPVSVFLRSGSATGSKKIALRVASGLTDDGSRTLTGLEGITFTTAVYVELSSAITGCAVTIGGVLDPQATAGGS